MRVDDKNDLKALGFIEGPDGNYYQPDDSRLKTLNQAKTHQAKEITATDIRVRDSRQVSIKERGVENAQRSKNETGKKRKESSRSSLSRENKTGKRYRIRVTSYRMADFDSDGIYAKWYIDELTNQGIIPDDSSVYVDCTSQWAVPVKTKKEERTLVEVYEYDYP